MVRRISKDAINPYPVLREGRIRIEGREGSFECERLSGQALMILRAGGVKKLMRQRFRKEE